MKISIAIISLFLAAPALAGECKDAISLPSGETFCLDASEVSRKVHPQCAKDPTLCPGTYMDACIQPGADPNSAACVAAKAILAAHLAIHNQCYDAGAARRTDAEAKSKCSKVWR
jgi:hypothetical protein